MSKRMPTGQARRDIFDSIIVLAHTYGDQVSTFNRDLIWNTFDGETRVRWSTHYKGFDNARSALAKNMYNLYQSNELGRVDGQLMTYRMTPHGITQIIRLMEKDEVGVGAPLTPEQVEDFLRRGLRSYVSGKVTEIEASSVPEEPEPHTHPHEEASSPNGFGNLIEIGTARNGNTLYMDPETRIVGVLTFTPIGRGE